MKPAPISDIDRAIGERLRQIRLSLGRAAAACAVLRVPLDMLCHGRGLDGWEPGGS